MGIPLNSLCLLFCLSEANLIFLHDYLQAVKGHRSRSFVSPSCSQDLSMSYLQFKNNQKDKPLLNIYFCEVKWPISVALGIQMCTHSSHQTCMVISSTNDVLIWTIFILEPNILILVLSNKKRSKNFKIHIHNWGIKLSVRLNLMQL